MELELENINATIAENGFIIVPMVDLSGATPMVAHTVGLTRTLGVPELVIVGMDMRMAIGSLHFVVDAMRAAGRHFVEREMIPLPPEAGPNVSPITVADALPEEVASFPMPVIHAIYGEEAPNVKFQQVIIPAMGNFYPWDEGFPAPGPIQDSQMMFWTPGGVKKVAPGARGDAECTDLSDLIPDALRADKPRGPLH